MMYFTSDFHFSHSNILNFERGQFNTISEHDQYIVRLIQNWSQKWVEGSTLWFLGDFGNPDYLWVFNILRNKGCTVNFLFGNHDRWEDLKDIIDQYVDNVYRYPVYLSKKFVVSHEPVAVYEDTVNVHGHLHASKLRDINHINANIHVANYQPISEKYLGNVFSQLPKYTRRFLYEPYAADYVFTQKKDDAIYDRNGRIDLSASRVQLKMSQNIHEYKGGFVNE